MDNKTLYKQICSQRPDIPVFLKDWWLDAVCHKWDVCIANKEGIDVGVWPYPIEQKMGVTLHRTPKLTPYLGPYALTPARLKENRKDRFEYETISQLIAQLPPFKMWHLALQPGLKQAGIFKNFGCSLTVQQTFLLDLTQPEATLLANIKDNTRRDIKTPGTDITITDDPSHLKDLYHFQKHTLTSKQVGLNYTYTDLQRLMDACLRNNASSFWVSKQNGQVISIVWNVWDSKRSYYFMGAQNPNIGHHKATPALLWHTILKSKERGNEILDFEGSMDAGVERFFRGFGGRRELYMVLKKNSSLLWRLKEIVKG